MAKFKTPRKHCANVFFNKIIYVGRAYKKYCNNDCKNEQHNNALRVKSGKPMWARRTVKRKPETVK
jgi:hypothetical protein